MRRVKENRTNRDRCGGKHQTGEEHRNRGRKQTTGITGRNPKEEGRVVTSLNLALGPE